MALWKLSPGTNLTFLQTRVTELVRIGTISWLEQDHSRNGNHDSWKRAPSFSQFLLNFKNFIYFLKVILTLKVGLKLMTPSPRGFLDGLYVSFLDVLLFVITVEILLERGCGRIGMTYNSSEIHFNETMLQKRTAYTKAKWNKLTVSNFWSVCRRQRKWCVRNKLSAVAMQINTPNYICVCVFPKDCLTNVIINGNIFLGKKKNSPQRQHWPRSQMFSRIYVDCSFFPYFLWWSH